MRLAAVTKNEADHPWVLLIDEPGSYLHERAQRDVLEVFEQLASKKHQVVYSTHHRALLPVNELYRLRIVVKNGSKGTVVYGNLSQPDLQGEKFKDTITPILDAIGLDLRLTFGIVDRDRNLLVEGASDRLYLQAWAKQLDERFATSVNVFPFNGTRSVVTFASLFIGWGFDYIVLLDNDDAGQSAKKKLVENLGVEPGKIVQLNNAKVIEDLFSIDDFKRLLNYYGNDLELIPGEKPSAAISRLRINKLLLAKTFSENADELISQFTKATRGNIEALLKKLEQAFGPA